MQRGFHGRPLGCRSGLGGLMLFPIRRDRGLGLITTPTNFDPDVVAAARRHHVEAIVANVRQPMLHRAEFFERGQRLRRQQLRHHADGRLERELVRRDVERALANDDVRPFADVHHQRVAVGADYGGEQRFS